MVLSCMWLHFLFFSSSFPPLIFCWWDLSQAHTSVHCQPCVGGLSRNPFTQLVGEGLTFLTHIQLYWHGPTDLFLIRASSSATRFYLTKPRFRPRREFALPNSLFDNKAESPDPTFISFEWRMKSALPQQAPTPIKMKSVTLLNKQEKPFTSIE